MELGIIELTEIEKLEVLGWASKAEPLDFAFKTIMDNNFEVIPEGFTGVYMRDTTCQVVPDAIIPEIKRIAVGGFDHAPEDHELHLFIDRRSTPGNWLYNRIIEMVTQWMNKEL